MSVGGKKNLFVYHDKILYSCECFSCILKNILNLFIKNRLIKLKYTTQIWYWFFLNLQTKTNLHSKTFVSVRLICENIVLHYQCLVRHVFQST